MIQSIKILAAAGILTAFAGGAQAAPSNLANAGAGVTDGIVKVHGYHRYCERGRNGWHRHNRYGERRHCREWRGGGRRPDYCVQFGPIWYCDY